MKIGEWSDRDKAQIQFSNVTGIEVLYDPVTDPTGEDPDLTFDWTLQFTLDGEYTICLGWYLTEEEAKYEAYLYAKECWENADSN